MQKLPIRVAARTSVKEPRIATGNTHCRPAPGTIAVRDTKANIRRA